MAGALKQREHLCEPFFITRCRGEACAQAAEQNRRFTADT
jgi:hypothetical protein